MYSVVKRWFILAVLCLPFITNKIIAGYADVWVHPTQNVVAVKTYFPAGLTWRDQTCLALYSVLGAQSFVTSAWYGDPAASKSIGNGRNDVTSVVNNIINHQQGGLHLAGSSFNTRFGNPAAGVTKTLSITFANSTTTTAAANESTSAYTNVATGTQQIGSFNYMKLPGDSLSLITVIPGDFNAAAWSSDGNYLAVGGGMDMRSAADCGFLNKDKLRIYNFTGVALVHMTSAGYPTVFRGKVYDISWKPGSTAPYYLAVAGTMDAFVTNQTTISVTYGALTTFSFNATTDVIRTATASSIVAASFDHVAWSPNGSYIAATTFTAPAVQDGNANIRLYAFDSALTITVSISSAQFPRRYLIDNGRLPCTALTWSSSSDRIGLSLSTTFTGGSTCAQTLIYKWTPPSTLTHNCSIGHGATGSWNSGLAWNHDDTKLAVYMGNGNHSDGIFPLSNYDPIRVYNYTKGVPDRLRANSSASVNSSTDGTALQQFGGTVGWGPADRFLAVGTYGALANYGSGFGTSANADLRVYGWQFSNLLPVVSYGYGTGGQGTITAMAWSSDGLYLAVGGTNGAATGGFTTNYQVRIYQLLNGLTLVPVTGFNYGTSVNALAWSGSSPTYYLTVGGSGAGSDGITGGFTSATNNLRMYSFNGMTVAAYSSYAFGITINALEWTNNQYLAVGGVGGTLKMFNVVSNALNLFASLTYTSNGTPTTIASLSWSPWSAAGGYLAVCGASPIYSIYYLNASNNTITLMTLTNDGSVVLAVTSPSYYSSFNLYGIAWDKTITSFPYKLLVAYIYVGLILYIEEDLFNISGTNVSWGGDFNAVNNQASAVASWVTIGGDRYIVGNSGTFGVYNILIGKFNYRHANNQLYANHNFSYGTGLTAIAANPVYANFFALGGTSPTNDIIAAGFADTNELRLYSVPATSFLPMASQTYGNTINTNDLLRPENGKSVSLPGAFTLSPGEGITGAVDMSGGLSLLSTKVPSATIATTQSLHDGDLDLTQGCIQLDGALRLGPESNILTSTQAAPRGSIYLKNQTLFLQGDTTLSTTITNFQTAVQLLSPGTIDGLGYNLAINGPVMLRIAGSTPLNAHVLRNITFSNLWDFHANGDWYPFYDDGGNGVIFENVTFLTQPGQTVTLATPSITIEGTCAIVGGGTFRLASYGGVINPVINIASGAILYVGQGTTLRAHVINFADQTSMLSLDGATLLNTCATGPLHLTKGTLNYNGLVTLSSLYNSSFAIGNGISEAQDLHIVGQAAATLKFDQSSTCTGKSTCWYRNVH